MTDKKSKGYQEAVLRIIEWKQKGDEDLPIVLDCLSLTELPKELLELEALQKLSLRENQINKLPKDIIKLKNLEYLFLYDNQLSELPKEIGELKNLQRLSLYNNQLRALPKEIFKLKKLEYLWLFNNDLIELPIEILELKDLKALWLENNLKLNIPQEIVVKVSRPHTILNYYFENVYQIKEQDKEPLKEIKVLLVGQGRVGKTSLVRYLVAKQKRNLDEKTTHGIFRTPWKINVVEAETNETHSVQLNLWDFGGQDIMHATHEFFLTKRSLYLLVLDAGLSKEANRLEYWLKKIQTYGQNAPIFIVINKSEANKLEIPLKTLQETYNIQGLFEISCDNGFNADALEQKIIEQVGKMPEVFRRVNKNWFAVKDELEKLKQDYIPIEQYRQICFSHRVTDPTSQNTLLIYLNELGIMLNFREDNTKVLNPEWVTRGVYKLITSVKVRDNKAVLTPEILEAEMESLNEELAKEEKEYLSYPPDKYEYIIKLMKKFELCYEIQGTKNYYIPGRLDEDKPADIGDWNEKECLGFRYDYGKGFLHESVMSRFIVKTHRLIVGEKQWLTGVVLVNDNGNMALVRADLTNGLIKILIDGNKTTRRQFLAVIRNHFQDIHADIKLNKPVEEVPLDEFPDKFVEYEKLLQLESANINENYETVDGNLIKVDVNKLLNGLTTAERREKDRADLQKIREEERNYQDGFIDGLAKREKLDINVVLYTQEREVKIVESKLNLVDSARLQKLEGQKELLDAQAETVGGKKAIAVITVSLIIYISSFISLVLLIFDSPEDGWNKFEKWTFVVFLGLGIIYFLGSLAFFIVTKQDFSWASLCTLMIERQRTKLYLRNGNIDNEIVELRKKLKASQQ